MRPFRKRIINNQFIFLGTVFILYTILTSSIYLKKMKFLTLLFGISLTFVNSIRLEAAQVHLDQVAAQKTNTQVSSQPQEEEQEYQDDYSNSYIPIVIGDSSQAIPAGVFLSKDTQESDSGSTASTTSHKLYAYHKLNLHNEEESSGESKQAESSTQEQEYQPEPPQEQRKLKKDRNIPGSDERLETILAGLNSRKQEGIQVRQVIYDGQTTSQ